MLASAISPHHAAAPASPRTSSRQPLKVMGFRSAQSEKMIKTAKDYVRAWQQELATGEPGNLRQALSNVAPSGIMYRADGVVHTHDRHKSVEELAAHIQDRYAAYNHVIHDVFSIAVDEPSRNVYLGVRYVMQNQGPVAGKGESTGRLSQGVLLERLELDEEGRIAEALVCRPMTLEERDSLTVDPSAVVPGPIPDDLLYTPEENLNAQDMSLMRENTEAWVHCWDTGSPYLQRLDEILSPEVQQISGYGLGKRSVPFAGIEAAHKAIEAAQSHLDISNHVLNMAMCDDRRAGFVHWRADGLKKGAGHPEFTKGLDYLRFDDKNRITCIYNFTMRGYTNLKQDESARSDKVD